MLLRQSEISGAAFGCDLNRSEQHQALLGRAVQAQSCGVCRQRQGDAAAENILELLFG